MVGDYVLIDGKPRRVDAVHQKKVGWHSVHYKMEWARFGVIEPIKIDRNINEQIAPSFGLMWNDDDDDTYTLYCEGEHRIRYVHELQDYIRLITGNEIELNFE